MKRILTLSIGSLLLIWLTIFTEGCKKTDSLTENNTTVDNEVTQRFFNLSPTEHPFVRRIAAELKKRNDANPFVTDFARANGFPIWDKAILAPKSETILQRDGDGELIDTLVYIPLVLNDSLEVNGSILAKVKGDSMFFKYVLAQDYKAYPFTGGRNIVTADQFATFMLVLNREVFGHEAFTITDERLFADSSYPHVDTTTKQISFDTSTVDNLNIPSRACEYFQVRVCGLNGGLRTGARTTTPGGNTSCYTFIQERCYNIFDDVGGWGGSNSGGSSGGSGGGSGPGSSGGSSIPHDYPCQTTNTCSPPGGGIGWFPLDPNDHPQLEQQLNTILTPGDSYFFQTIDSDDVIAPTTVQQFQDYLDSIENVRTFDTASTIVLSPSGDTLVKKRVNRTFVAGIDIFLKSTKNSGYWDVVDVTSGEWGMSVGWSWTQNSFSASVSGNSVIVDVYGYENYNVILEGIGTIYKNLMHYRLTMNRTTGKITSIISL